MWTYLSVLWSVIEIFCFVVVFFSFRLCVCVCVWQFNAKFLFIYDQYDFQFTSECPSAKTYRKIGHSNRPTWFVSLELTKSIENKFQRINHTNEPVRCVSIRDCQSTNSFLFIMWTERHSILFTLWICYVFVQLLCTPICINSSNTREERTEKKKKTIQPKIFLKIIVNLSR